jgi:hypothetical protein
MASERDILRQQAIDDIAHYEREIIQLRERCEERRVFLRVLHDLETSSENNGSSKPSSSDEVADQVRTILHRTQEPLSISKLYDEVIAAGLVIGGKNPKSNLSAKLAPYDDIIYIKDKGWKLSTFSPKQAQYAGGHLRIGPAKRRRGMQQHSSSPSLNPKPYAGE